MKKLVVLIVTLLLLCSCEDENRKVANPEGRYNNVIEMLKSRDAFLESSDYFDINVELAKIDDGYRFYVVIDNPHVALYDVEAIAIEDGVDYSKNMAANIGIFEENEYSLIPNQANNSKGFVSGIVFSGTTMHEKTTLYIFVQWKNKDYTVTRFEYFKLDVEYEQ